MSTHVPGFQSFFGCFFNHLVLSKLDNSSIRVKLNHRQVASIPWLCAQAETNSSHCEQLYMSPRCRRLAAN